MLDLGYASQALDGFQSSEASPPAAEQRQSVAQEHAECPICFEALPSAPTAVLSKRGHRSCRHFFHVQCIAAMESSGIKCCPCCRAEFDGNLRIPNVEAEPQDWFKLVDFNGDGALTVQEVMEVLKATLYIDVDRMEQDLPSRFAQWDRNNDGKIEFNEMMGSNGLFYYVRDSFRAENQVSTIIPSIRRNRHEWFRYWDEDSSGTLDKEEVVRSFVKTFKLGTAPDQAQCLHALVSLLWSEFDPNGSGAIDIDEFCKPNSGLADMIIANLGS